MPEKQYDLTRKKHIPVKHPKDVTGVICSNCMQILLTSTQEQIKRAYQKAVHAGLMDKTRALETFLEEEEQDVRKTKKHKRNFIRKGPLRMVRPTSYQIRPQPPAI